MDATESTSGGSRKSTYARDHTFNRIPSRPFLWFARSVVFKTPLLKKAVIDLFENIFYDSAKSTWDNMSWRGVPCQKYPTDLWVYQEIIFRNRPDTIIETGTAYGGSALYMASLMDLAGHGRVISVDIRERGARPVHPRITYILGSSTSDEVIEKLSSMLESSEKRMVVLDSDHRKSHVDEELRVYSRLVTVGQYLIVEDSSVNGHPISAQFGEGPYESVESFLRENKGFSVDKSMEKFLLSSNHNGFLLRVQ